jgi:hypothetical protein
MSQAMLECYSHILLAAKREAVEASATVRAADGTRNWCSPDQPLLLEMRHMLGEGYWEDLRDVQRSLEWSVFDATSKEIDRIN